MTHVEKRSLEEFLQMGNGYVLDFSNRTFQEFVLDSTGLDIDDQSVGTNGDGRAAGVEGSGASGDAGIVESGAHSVTAQGEVQVSVGCREGSLRILQRSSQCEAIVEALDHADAVLPRKTEAHIIVRVDGHRPGCVQVVNALPVFCQQGPHLTASEAPAIVKGNLTPCLPLAQRVTVGLVIV